ncbi:hypothetical protein VFPPC_11338 [Pochonia chlamydosporia 170]|uniref:CFEM domain-containing protein n=1 Tax=Pochonia chlamydosporia 170 TaxID=1380566 RepID=A0A179EY23_METCM|nr:hypothetical protein VFPPC_11338 [Pochonia chlamydosporia 170]OAQ58096.1 hypothetical protein VFPPC_11338 [Pochonia chlamydosporia 170]
MKLIFALFLAIGLAQASCSRHETSIRCDSGWEDTDECAKELGNTRTCYCVENFRTYYVANYNVDDFKKCCDSKSGHINWWNLWRLTKLHLSLAYL